MPEKGGHDLSVPWTLFAGGTAGVVNCLVCVLPDVALSHFQTTAPEGCKHIAAVYLKMVSTAHDTQTQDGLDTVQLALVVFFLSLTSANTPLALTVVIVRCNLRWCFFSEH